MERVFGYTRILATGAPAPLATIHVYLSGTPSHAPIYQDDLSPPTPLANPLSADSNGFFFFYTPNALVDLQFSGGGIVTPYAWGERPAGGIGDGGLLPVSSSSFPAVSPQHRGRLRLLGDSALGPPGVWVQDLAAWQPALDYAFRSYARAALPGAPQAGMVRRVADGPQGLFVADAAGWVPAMGFGFDSVAAAALPTPGVRARVRQVTDGVRGLWVDQLAQWFSLTHEAIDAREFGATGDGSTDDTAALQAALDAAPATGGTVVIPGGGRSYKTIAPLVVKDGTTIIGWGATLLVTGSGDCAIRSTHRDNNSSPITDTIRVIGLGISFAHAFTPFTVFDLTGLADSLFFGVRVQGPVTSIAGQSAFRLADNNPTGTSNKQCIGNMIHDAFVADVYTFLLAIQSSTRVTANALFHVTGRGARQGFNVAGVSSGTLPLVCFGGRFEGTGSPTGSAQAVTTPAPSGMIFFGVRATFFSDGNGALPSANFVKDDLSVGASGTSSTSPLAPGGAAPETFAGSAYLKVPAGTIIPAGSSSYDYNLPGISQFVTFLFAPVTGLPSASPLSFQASLKTGGGTVLSLTIVSGTALTLASDLVLRVIQVGP